MKGEMVFLMSLMISEVQMSVDGKVGLHHPDDAILHWSVSFILIHPIYGVH